MPRARVGGRSGSADEHALWAERFGVSLAQVDHDRAISYILAAIATQADHVVFYGGTALARTVSFLICDCRKTSTC